MRDINHTTECLLTDLIVEGVQVMMVKNPRNFDAQCPISREAMLEELAAKDFESLSDVDKDDVVLWSPSDLCVVGAEILSNFMKSSQKLNQLLILAEEFELSTSLPLLKPAEFIKATAQSVIAEKKWSEER